MAPTVNSQLALVEPRVDYIDGSSRITELDEDEDEDEEPKAGVKRIRVEPAHPTKVSDLTSTTVMPRQSQKSQKHTVPSCHPSFPVWTTCT